MERKKKLLLVGGGDADVPLILAAKELGYYVISSGNRPSDMGHKYSDEYDNADFSDPESILALAKKHKISAICSSCNDFSAISCAYVAEKLGLPGHDSYEISQLIHHKDLYRDYARSMGIPTPKAIGVKDVPSALAQIKGLQFPVMVKPVDLTGGKGIARINTYSEAENALKAAFSISKSKRVVIEEFIEGSHHGFSAFVNNGKVVFYFADNEHYYLNPYMVSAASTPTIVGDEIIAELVTITEKVVLDLKLKAGIFHIQYILSENGPVIIEICRRPPGDLYIKLVEYATGCDYSKWIVKAAAGEDCSGLSHVPTTGFHTRHCIMADKKGIVESVNVSDTIKLNIVDSCLWWSAGDCIDMPLTQKLGIVFLCFESMEDMLDKTENLNDLISVVIKE